MTEPQPSNSAEQSPTYSKIAVIPTVLGLVILFIVLLFPWDSLARRVAWEISIASGANVAISTLAPSLTARGPVLRARDVVIEHPAIDRLKIQELEIAPRELIGWLTGKPRLRLWTTTELGKIDGLLGLGETPNFVGSLSRIELSRLPLRLGYSGLKLAGQLDGEADITLDPKGTLRGRMTFRSTNLVLSSALPPIEISFQNAEGVIELLESGATRIESLKVESELLEGQLSGEVGLAHHSQSPPIDLNVDMQIIDADLQRLALSAGFPVSLDGRLNVRVRGTLDAPEFDGDGSQRNTQLRSNRRARARKNR